MKKANIGAVLVTGGAKRIGQEICMDLAQLGYKIALHYNSSKQQAINTAKKINNQGGYCELFSCDLSDTRETQRLIAQVYKSFPTFNLLVNSASIFIPNTFGATNLELFDSHWAINFKAPYILSCEFARLVKKGQIINFIDTNSVKYQSRYHDYLLTKKALAEFTKMAAVSWGPSIRVNGISPGMILPPVNSQKEDRLDRAKKIPLKKVGNTKYILKTLEYLIENTYLTGQIIAVDGGEQLV